MRLKTQLPQTRRRWLRALEQTCVDNVRIRLAQSPEGSRGDLRGIGEVDITTRVRRGMVQLERPPRAAGGTLLAMGDDPDRVRQRGRGSDRRMAGDQRVVVRLTRASWGSARSPGERCAISTAMVRNPIHVGSATTRWRGCRISGSFAGLHRAVRTGPGARLDRTP
jgi:hypothetical protein